MNQIRRKIAIWIAMLVLIFSCLPCYAMDKEKDVSLTIQYAYEGNPICDVEFEIFYVAEITEENQFELVGDFEKYPVRMNGLDADGWRAMANTLSHYAQRDKLVPMDQGKTNEQGFVKFPTTEYRMPQGLYLVNGKPKVEEEYTYYTEAFLVCLPDLDENKNEWKYDVTVFAKNDREENEEIPSLEKVDKQVLKIWKEDDETFRPDDIQVQLMKNGEVFDTVVLNVENNWYYMWEQLPQYDEQGLRIDWGILEEDVKDYHVSISQDGNTFIITNTYDPYINVEGTISKTLYKVWDDKGYEEKRPNQISVHLLKNGTKYDTKVLNAETDWMYSWENLPVKDEEGQIIEWTIEEETLSGYKAKVEEKGDNFVLTNTVVKASLPQTGLLWWPVPILISVGLLFMILGKWIKNRA